MRIAFLTAGGLAPCLSSSIGLLMEQYSKLDIEVKFFAYKNGYKGLLNGDLISIPNHIVDKVEHIISYGGSFIGNSRVKLTNIEDCIKNGYIDKGENPLTKAANQLREDNINILHTIGGDDTNTTAGDLVKYLNNNNYNLTVVGLPKTVDNDVYPIHQTLGAVTAAEQGALFFNNIVNENTTSSRQLIIHEIMGRNCGWLTAATAYEYRKSLSNKIFIPEILLNKKKWDIHAIYLPEQQFDFQKECLRLKKTMDEIDCVNIFLSEGAGLETILNEIKSNGKDVKYDAFGHVRLDEINPGLWFAKNLKNELNADKVLVQKSGYFSRSSAPNVEDINLIRKSSEIAIQSAINNESGVIGLDEENDNKMSCIEFDRIKGGKPFNTNIIWYKNMLKEIQQI